MGHIYSPLMTNARRRQQVIRHLLETEEIGSQAGLLELLAQRGHHTTQPVLSRDLRAVNAAKRAGRYQLLPAERVTPLSRLQTLLRHARPVGENLVIIFCEAGAASAIARALESEPTDGLIGTVAGDDTLFVAVEDAAAGRRLVEHIVKFLSPSAP